MTLDLTLLENNLGGSGVYARALVGALQSRSDLDVALMSAPSRGGGFGTLGWLWRGARSRLLEDRPSVVHYPGFLAPIQSPVPSVLTIHDLSLGRMPKGHPFEWRMYYHHVLPRAARHATVVITPTEATKIDVVTAFDVAPERIVVTPYGINEQFFSATAPAQGDAAHPLIVFAGPAMPRKNLGIVLRTLASSRDGSALSRARLLITGSRGGDSADYQSWIAAHGLAGRVTWLGALPFAELPALYARADVLVYPSFLEGFGFPPLEAMASGTPVVASNASCLPEVLGDAAILVDPNDDSAFAAATESVLADQQLRARLIRRGRAHASTFTWERCAELTVNAYRSAAAV